MLWIIFAAIIVVGLLLAGWFDLSRRRRGLTGDIPFLNSQGGLHGTQGSGGAMGSSDGGGGGS